LRCDQNSSASRSILAETFENGSLNLGAIATAKARMEQDVFDGVTSFRSDSAKCFLCLSNSIADPNYATTCARGFD
jgi:hypothetical protein